MSFKRMSEFTGQYVEHIDGTVHRSRYYVFTVRTIRNARYKRSCGQTINQTQMLNAETRVEEYLLC